VRSREPRRRCARSRTPRGCGGGGDENSRGGLPPPRRWLRWFPVFCASGRRLMRDSIRRNAAGILASARHAGHAICSAWAFTSYARTHVLLGACFSDALGDTASRGAWSEVSGSQRRERRGFLMPSGNIGKVRKRHSHRRSVC